MMQTVQLLIADAVYATGLREALSRTGPWHVESVEQPETGQKCVLVLDEMSFLRLHPALTNPERVVLITRKDPQVLAQAWDAGIVSVVSEDDPINTVLLAIMAAALRAATTHGAAVSGGVSPSHEAVPESIDPHIRCSGSKRSKSQ